MNPKLELQQLLIVRTAVVAKSDVSFALEEFALRTAVAFGSHDRDFEAVFAQPADAKTIAVVTAKQTEAVLSFRFLFVNAELYRWIGDPFEIADRFPIDAHARGTLPSLLWPDEPRPQRTVHEVQRVLKSGEGPLLLGAVQAILDGARLRAERQQPDRDLIRGLWTLLPDASRGDLWPAEFCPGDLPFHLACSPNAKAGTITEEQARDYPAGRYELALQLAAEAGDQAALDQLLSRRAPKDILRLALAMLAFAVLVVLGIRFIK